MIRQANLQDTSEVAALALELWPGHGTEELTEEMAALLNGQDTAIFLYMEEAIVEL